LNEKRTFFGLEGIKIVTEFFKGEKYANNPNAIARYAKWAVRGNGPALYGKPTPRDCVIKKGTDGYIVCFQFSLQVLLLMSLFRNLMAYSRANSSSSYSRNISSGARVLALTMANRLVLSHWRQQV